MGTADDQAERSRMDYVSGQAARSRRGHTAALLSTPREARWREARRRLCYRDQRHRRRYYRSRGRADAIRALSTRGRRSPRGAVVAASIARLRMSPPNLLRCTDRIAEDRQVRFNDPWGWAWGSLNLFITGHRYKAAAMSAPGDSPMPIPSWMMHLAGQDFDLRVPHREPHARDVAGECVYDPSCFGCHMDAEDAMADARSNDGVQP